MEARKLLERVQDEEKEGFVITDDQMADWALRKIAKAKLEAAQWKAFYLDRISKAQITADETEARMTALLERYFDTVPHAHAKTQSSYTLPSGKLVRKAESLEYLRDTDKLLVYLQSSGLNEFIKIEAKPKWGEYKDRVQIAAGVAVDSVTGEIVSGVTVEKRDPVFKVEVSGGD